MISFLMDPAMNEIPKRLVPTHQTYRELFLKSGNLCAFPGCGALMIDEEGNFIGQLCHIEAAEPGGERFNPAMTNEERRSVSNLMLMCYPHHCVTNDVERYSVAHLREMKSAHERRFSRPDRAIREKLEKLKWTSLVSAGAVAGMGFAGIVHQIRSAFDSLIGSRGNEQPTSLRGDLQQTLRYIPTGTIYCYSRDPAHKAVGGLFLEILKGAGWRIEWLNEPPTFKAGEPPDFDRSMLMMFVVTKKDQLSNVRQAISEFFRICGFSTDNRKDEVVREGGSYPIRFHLLFMAQPK